MVQNQVVLDTAAGHGTPGLKGRNFLRSLFSHVEPPSTSCLPSSHHLGLQDVDAILDSEGTMNHIGALVECKWWQQ